MFRWFLLLMVLLATATGLAIGVLNAERVTFNLIAGTITLPLGGLVLAALVVGVISGICVAWALFLLPGRLRRSRQPITNHKGTDLADSRDA